MNYEELKAETLLPEYSAMTDEEIATAMNLANIGRVKSSMSGNALLEAQDPAEFSALTAAKKSQWLALCAIDSVNPSGQVVEVVKDIWGNGSTTVANLATARNETVSRAIELGLGVVTSTQIKHAKDKF